ncbi:NADH:ubiquinone reductase (Na(+)-transporting) subunit B [Flavobacterium sediminilitoris]|uniref:Na(+)-translocating NADH-quinone reductase subunit B n=1 Tax=Flavobacterium sediminilitoris TaxID=2024526 RepID=A0ABY4HNE5_9FLAO|nr:MULTISPECIES: NADH:ubiquinone reductase (Na(+)-transporting) subunit B [Flavobacterium]UOX34392.1 NADH:ubiquinone reductase (Na(+)-transporting) subunit B [Flavobacterium sediminilitoris]
MGLKQNLHNLKEKYKGTKFEQGFNALHTFLYVPNITTHSGSHVRDATDLKRVMNTVIMAMVPVLLFGMFNAGYQYNLATNGVAEFLTMDNFIVGLKKILPLLVVSYGVGLGIEFIFATVKKHEVEEGYLVTGMLVPLIVPIDLPLWMLAVAVAFGVIIAKELFGGTGMNVLNPALTIRAFLFFNWAAWMSGDKVWVHGSVERANEIANLKLQGIEQLPDAISGETILGTLAANKPVAYSATDMFFGYIPGSVGETSTFLILLGAAFLIFTGIGSARIMISSIIGAVVMGLIFNGIVDAGVITESSKFYGLMAFPFWQHLLVGGLAFGIVYMATDPVSASQTNKGKIIYGFLIGFISILIRVFNPAYPEGVMMAILLMNVFAPTIDHYVVQGNVKRRMKRLKTKTA